MVISDGQLESLISTLGINARTLHEVGTIITPPNAAPTLRMLFSKVRQSLLDQEYSNVDPCAWNMFLRRRWEKHVMLFALVLFTKKAWNASSRSTRDHPVVSSDDTLTLQLILLQVQCSRVIHHRSDSKHML